MVTSTHGNYLCPDCGHVGSITPWPPLPSGDGKA